MSEIQTAEASPALVSENPLPDSSQTQEIESQETSNPDDALDSELSGIWRKNNPDRFPDGKFSPREDNSAALESNAADNTQDQAPKEETVEQAKPAIDPPSSWSREMRDEWATASPKMQEFVAKRESETHSAITRLGQQAKAYEPIASVLEQNRDVFQAHNMPYEAGIERLVNAQRQLDRDPVSAIQWLAKSYNVDLQQFAQNGEQQASDPHYATLQHKIANLEAQLSQTTNVVQTRVRQDYEAQQNVILKQVEDFTQKNQISEAEEAELAVFVSAERQLHPEKDAGQALKDAFDKWQFANPARRTKILSQQQADAEKARSAEAAKKASDARKAGAINVKSTPVKGNMPQDWDTELRGIYRQSKSR